MPTTSGADRPVRLRAFGQAIVEWGGSDPAEIAAEIDGRSAEGSDVDSGREGSIGWLRPQLPWRHTREPWAILVSEVMAQQTQVGRVIPIYMRFMDRFPTPSACADAPLGEVLRAWAGLGYNRRARFLHRAAQAMVENYGGRVPDTLEDLLALPGVGAYTARAVMVFAYEADIGVVDTNTGRVLSRAVAGRPLTRPEAQALVDAMVPPGQGWLFGQSLLDLGAMVCAGANPACHRCPVRRRCRWAAAGRTDPDPARGSAGVSVAQSVFHGSDRQGRGRLVAALRDGPVSWVDLAEVMGWPDDGDRARRVASQLASEGLIREYQPGLLELP
jgi:A/G-specific adenine glycosylase